MIDEKFLFPVGEKDLKCAIFAQKRVNRRKFYSLGSAFQVNGVYIPVLFLE